MSAEIQFVDIMRRWLTSLPHDLKILYEAASDENLSRKTRELATGAILYTVSPNDLVSHDLDDFSGYADDCLLVRLALRQGLSGSDEDSQTFRARFDDFFSGLEEELVVCKTAMGDLYSWLESKIDRLATLEYKSKKVAQYLDDEELSEQLYEDGLGFRTEYPIDEDNLADRFKKASTVLEGMQRRRDQESRKRA